MKVLLTTLNAKFVHTSLALWYLYQSCRDTGVALSLREFNINQDLNWICGEIYLERADAIAFSCNIWNIEPNLKIIRRLKAVASETAIILGGPEVSTAPIRILEEYPEVDFIVAGEGEITFREWLLELAQPHPAWPQIAGLTYRRAGIPVSNEPHPPIKDLSIVPFPYPEDLAPFRQKMVYYESSRGCPNHCQYCLSANEHGVRFFPLDRVKEELARFAAAGIGQVKFVDRTFNCHPGRAREIWRFLIELARRSPVNTNFHFEIMGEQLDPESLDLLAEAPPGLFQFEIGVQSTHPETLDLIQRRMDFNKLREQVARLISARKVFVHLDLIAGLPAEDYPTFGKTFDDNLVLEPDRLQLGFLKLLKGSGLRNRAAEFGYRFTAEPPYEVMANHWLSYAELLRLKLIEDLLERYYNSGWFRLSLPFVISGFATPFAFFESFAAWWKERGYDQCSHKTKDLYEYLLHFDQEIAGRTPQLLAALLKYDLLSRERLVELPEWAGPPDPELRQLGYQFWLEPQRREQFIPELAGLAPRDISRRVLFVRFPCDPAAYARGLESPAPPPEVVESTLYLFIYLDNNKVRIMRVE